MTATFEERIAALDAADADEKLRRARDLLAQASADPAERGTLIEGTLDLLHEVTNPEGVTGSARIAEAPTYPTKWLPRPMLAQLDSRGSLDEAAVAAGMLGIASAASMPATLIVEGTRRVVPTLWISSIGDAGCGKTPAWEISYGPYREREAEAARRYVAEMKDWQALDQKERRVMPKPVNTSRVSDDATLEAVARRLNTTHESLALIADELSGVLRGIGQYKRDGGGDKPRYLSLWSGQGWTYERVGSSENPLFIFIERPVLPIFGTIQPELIGLLGDIGSGMQARWLPHLSGMREGIETGRPAEVWETTLGTLLHRIDSRREWTLPAGGEARAEHQGAEQRWAAQRRDTGETAASSSFLAKGGEHALRVALVLAEVDAAWQSPGDHPRTFGGDLPLWAVRGGIELVDYCAAVWRLLPGGDTPIVHSYGARAIVERDGQLNAWLRVHGGSATRREILRAHVAGCRTRQDVDALLMRHREVYGNDAVIHDRGGQRVYAR